MAVIRRSTSATSRSDTPDFNTMIISASARLSGPPNGGAKKGRGLVARGLGGSSPRAVRPPPCPRKPADRRHDREDPERHRAHSEQVRDDVLRKAGDQIEDEADDRALGLDDEVHLLPVVLAEPRPDQRLTPQP